MSSLDKYYNRKLMELAHKEDLLKSKLKNIQNKIFITKIEYEDLKKKQENNDVD